MSQQQADYQNTLRYNNVSQIIGLTSLQILPFNGARRILIIQNNSATAKIAIQFGLLPASVGALGSITLLPGVLFYLSLGVTCQEVQMISDTTSTSVTILEG